MRRLLGIGSVYTLGGIAQMAASALALPVLSRLLSPPEYGQVAIVLSILVVLAPLFSLGIPSAIARLYFGADELTKTGPEVARRLVGTCKIVAAIGVAVTVASTTLWGWALAPVTSLALILGIATTWPLIAMSAAGTILQVEERPGSFVAVSLLGSAGAQLCGIGALTFVAATPTSYLVGYGTGVLVAAVVGAILTGTLRVRPAGKRAVRAALAIGLPTIPHGTAIFVLALGDRFVIQGIMGSGAVGRYQIAYALGTLPIAVLSALQTAWVPITYGATADRRWIDLASSALVITRLGAILVVSLVVVSPICLSILAPASFEPGELQAVCAIIALSALPWGMYLPMAQVLFWERNTKPLLWVTPTAAIANLILAVFLTNLAGLEGAAAATLLAFALQAILTERATRRMAAVPWRWGAMLSNAAGATACVAVVLLLPSGLIGLILRAALLLVLLAFGAKTISTAVRRPASVPATG